MQPFTNVQKPERGTASESLFTNQTANERATKTDKTLAQSLLCDSATFWTSRTSHQFVFQFTLDHAPSPVRFDLASLYFHAKTKPVPSFCCRFRNRGTLGFSNFPFRKPWDANESWLMSETWTVTVTLQRVMAIYEWVKKNRQSGRRWYIYRVYSGRQALVKYIYRVYWPDSELPDHVLGDWFEPIGTPGSLLPTLSEISSSIRARTWSGYRRLKRSMPAHAHSQPAGQECQSIQIDN